MSGVSATTASCRRTARSTATSSRSIKSVLAGSLLPTIAVATAELAQLAPGTQSWIVKVPAGYEAATWDNNGNVDFWKLAAGPWQKVGASRDPDLGPNDPPYDTKVTGALLTGMSDATFIATGEFSGDGTGTAEAYTLDPGKGWGIIGAGPSNTLVPTGQPATDNTTPGLRFRMTFSNGDIETTDQNPDFYVADGPEYALVTDWKWDGTKFTDVKDNVFTSHAVPAPVWGSNPGLPDNVCKVLNPAARNNITSPPPDGTYEVDLAVDDSMDQNYFALYVILSQNIGGVGTVCNFGDVSDNLPTTMEVASSSGTISWATMPLWMLRDPQFYLATIGPTPVATNFYPDDYTYGQSPLYFPPSLPVERLVNTTNEIVPALATISGGKLTALAVLPNTDAPPSTGPQGSSAPGEPLPSGSTGNTGAVGTTTQPPATSNTGSSNTGSTGNT